MAETDWKKKLKRLGLARERKPRAATSRPAGSSTRAVGDRGESEAALHLQERGVEILARNVRYGDGEIDLIGRLGADLLFVEVRLRSGDSRGTALESVTPLKRSRVVRAARRWLAENPTRGDPPLAVRFDVVGITRQPYQIDWIQGAFDATR